MKLFPRYKTSLLKIFIFSKKHHWYIICTLTCNSSSQFCYFCSIQPDLGLNSNLSCVISYEDCHLVSDEFIGNFHKVVNQEEIQITCVNTWTLHSVTKTPMCECNLVKRKTNELQKIKTNMSSFLHFFGQKKSLTQHFQVCGVYSN